MWARKSTSMEVPVRQHASFARMRNWNITELVYETINESGGNTPVAFLQAGDILIETYENKTAAMKRGAIDHLALNVPDIEPVYALAKEKGYQFLESDEIVFLPFWENGVRYFLIEGPNKEPIEFLQKL